MLQKSSRIAPNYAYEMNLLKPAYFNSPTKSLLISINRQRLFTTSRLTLNKESEPTEKKDKSKQQDFNPRHLGVASEVFIPSAYKNLPSVFTHPLIVANALVRRLYTFGLNSVQVALFRFQSGIKPSFLLWKNKAIETYVNVNTSFARKNLSEIKGSVSLWVQEALEARSRQLPSNATLDWQLIKFNAVPKLVSIQPIMVPGMPLEHLQLIYKLDTKQRLINVNQQTKKSEILDRDVVDYVAFLCDATTNDMILMGSLFENKPNDKLPKSHEDDTKVAIHRMKVNGDIYRLPSH
ncbi:Mba1p [Saccharomyces eubayanus]|uniref:Mba1p n=1 Tax=Saccharomyces eubayanus TaxID=1080349 RepID=UPI0006C6132E|nr:MBA1-like protein [Saccharomyces eubayanus]KOH00500.1 MBA1-like protein [Saccharomyces eubayanus]